MTTGQSQNATNIHVVDGGRLSVTFDGARGTLFVNETPYIFQNGVLIPANDQHATKNLAQRVLEVGQTLRDGTVLLSVDPDKDEALILPAEIFGGEATFDKQNGVVAFVNNKALPLHGHRDWRRITDDEGKTLADNWAKVTLRDPDWFWLASPASYDGGRARRGGEAAWLNIHRDISLPVPVVRSVSARNLDI